MNCCTTAEKIEAERVADFNEHQIDVEEAPTPTDHDEEELREQINKLQQQEKLQLEKKAAPPRACSIM